MKDTNDGKGAKVMELCDRCEILIDMHQDEGDYVYYRSENDSKAHPFCNNCLEWNDYSEVA